MFPLPLLSKSFFRGHLFINGGSLVPLETKNFLKSKIDFLTNHSIAIGVGLVARFTSFRLELNYCIPVRATVTDSLKPGFQLGIGMHFM
jgi:outer membrane protein insertion porin family